MSGVGTAASGGPFPLPPSLSPTFAISPPYLSLSSDPPPDRASRPSGGRTASRQRPLPLLPVTKPGRSPPRRQRPPPDHQRPPATPSSTPGEHLPFPLPLSLSNPLSLLLSATRSASSFTPPPLSLLDLPSLSLSLFYLPPDPTFSLSIFLSLSDLPRSGVPQPLQQSAAT